MEDDELVKEVHKIMNGDIGENFCSAYAMHLGSTKMYQTIKENYWWSSMKRDIVEFISRCLVCQQVKTEH